MAVLQLKASGSLPSLLLNVTFPLPPCFTFSSTHTSSLPRFLSPSVVFVIFHQLSVFANLRPYSALRLNSSSPLGSGAEGYRIADSEKTRSETIITTDREGRTWLPFSLSLCLSFSFCILFQISASPSLSRSLSPYFSFSFSSPDQRPLRLLLPVISGLTPPHLSLPPLLPLIPAP